MTNASVLLDALAEPTRRTIVERLAERPAAERPDCANGQRFERFSVRAEYCKPIESPVSNSA